MNSRPSAFTLIELLVVIVILGILMAVAVPTFLAQQQKAQDSKAQQQLDFAYKAARSETPDAGNGYPALNSLVTDIRQSEPELTLSQGSCVNSTSDKTIVADSTISTSQHLYLYAKSGSGTWWRLSASPTGAPTFTPLGTCIGPLAKTTLTSSANAITDANRTSGQGDGLANDSSYGAWEATTNQVTYGGFENGQSTGWGVYVAGGGSATIAASQEQAKFGSWSLKVVTDGVASNEGTSSGLASRAAVVPGQTWSSSVWVYDATPGVGLEIGEEWFTSSQTFITGVYKSFTTTGGWQHVTVTGTAPVNTAYVGVLGIRTTSTGPAEATTIYLDGIQLEQKNVATPYVEDSGATNSRSGSNIEIPVPSGVTGTQGWVAMRVAPEWPLTQPPGGGSNFDAILDWVSDANNWIGIQYREVGKDWKIQRTGGGTPLQMQNDPGVNPGFTNAGDRVTVVAYWTATTLGISVNGSAFQTAPAANPTQVAMPSSFEVGSRASGTNSFCDCNIYWFAAGAGTLSDSDAAKMYAWGDNDPTPQDFSAAAQAKETWAADNSTVVTG